MAPSAPNLQRNKGRSLESVTKDNTETQSDYDPKASFSTDWNDTPDARGSRSGSIIKSLNLSITIPQDNTSEMNPDFKTPQNPDEMHMYEDDDDAQSEMMVMQPSDSVSSMGSQMIRMDSNAALSQAGSFQNLHEINRDISKGNILGQFDAVREDANE